MNDDGHRVTRPPNFEAHLQPPFYPTPAPLGLEAMDEPREAEEARRAVPSSPPSPPRSSGGGRSLEGRSESGAKGKEREDVLPYMQNAVLEQQNAQLGPLPIHRSAAELASLASSPATSTSATGALVYPGGKGSVKSGKGFSQPPPPLQLAQPPRVQQYSPSSSAATPRGQQEDMLPYMQNAVLEQKSAGGDKPLPIQRTETTNASPSPSATASNPVSAEKGVGVIAQADPGYRGPPPALPLASHAQPPPLGHHALSIDTSTVASAAPQHTVDARASHRPHQISDDHAFGGHGHTHYDSDPGSHVAHRTDHQVIPDVLYDHHAGHHIIGHGGHALQPSHVSHADSLSGHTPHADHVLDGHHVADSHTLATHFGGHTVERQTPVFTEHALGGYSHTGADRHHAAAEYNFGGGHHVPNFTASAIDYGHLPTPPRTQTSTTQPTVQISREGMPRSASFDVKEPSLPFLILLLIIIPVLSLSPYWGYHGPSTVSAFMMDEFGISYLDLGLMFTLYSLPNLFMPFVAGSLIDKWGLSISSLLFNILCLVGNIMLAITYYMPGKPVSLLLISRVIFGFGGEAIIMCQQVMLARWFSGLSLVLASGFVQLFVLCVGSGGAFLFLPHFDEDGVNISLLHILFVSFWGFVFNLFYIACEWKWTPWLLNKRLTELRRSTTGSRTSAPLPLSPSTVAATVSSGAEAASTSTLRPSHILEDSALVGPGQRHLSLAQPDTHYHGAEFGDINAHHIPTTSHINLNGECMGGHHAGHSLDLAHHAPDLAHHVQPLDFDGHAAVQEGTPNGHIPSPSTVAVSLPARATRTAIPEGWGYFRIEGRAQVFTPNGREEWNGVVLEGGGHISAADRRINVQYATVSTSASPQLTAPTPASTSAQSTPKQPSTAPASTTPFLFYPRVFTSKTVGEDLQNLPLIYWLVAAMLFCITPVFPAFTAFAPLYFQQKFGLGAVSASRATSLVYCVGAAAPFAAFLISKLRVRSFIQILTTGGVLGLFISFYVTGDDSFLPWFLMALLGVLYCFILSNGYAWIELSVPSELLGTATTLSLVIVNAGLSLAPFLVGLLRELSSDFDSALLALAALAGTGLFFAALVLVTDIQSGRSVLLGGEPETEAERAEAQKLRALRRALAEAEEERIRQLQLEKAQEQQIEAEIRVEVERQVRQRRAARALQQQPLPLASLGSTSATTRQPNVPVASSSSSSPPPLPSAAAAPLSHVVSTAEVSERLPLLSPQQRPRAAAPKVV